MEVKSEANEPLWLERKSSFAEIKSEEKIKEIVFIRISNLPFFAFVRTIKTDKNCEMKIL